MAVWLATESAATAALERVRLWRLGFQAENEIGQFCL